MPRRERGRRHRTAGVEEGGTETFGTALLLVEATTISQRQTKKEGADRVERTLFLATALRTIGHRPK
jgi:hypothetical protein